MKKPQRIVLVPFPFQGHVTPMLQLGAILCSRGFSIAVAHTDFNSPDPLDYPQFDFHNLPDQLAGSDTSFYNMLNVIHVLNTNCTTPFKELLVRMLDEEERVCIIYDPLMHFADDAATPLGIPSMVLRTNSAAYVHSSLVALQLLAEKVLPVPESRLDDPVPRVHPLKFRNLPLPVTAKISEAVQAFTRSYMDIRSSAAAVIWNTMDMLDHTPLQQLHHRVPFFSVGPLHKMAPSLPTSLRHEDTSCLSWLDKQAPNSVVYVSFGSLANIDKNDLVEMAWGLANSHHPFLWVLRHSLINGSDCMDCLPEEFIEVTEGRGCIVRWAPQRKVLGHGSVGGFLSHCGWNSTLEAMSEGVPVICGPRFSDQMVNARYLGEWKVGLELERLDRACIERAIREVIVGKGGEEMRERAMNMKQEIEVAINRGGSSKKALDDLVNFITSFSLGK